MLWKASWRPATHGPGESSRLPPRRGGALPCRRDPRQAVGRPGSGQDPREWRRIEVLPCSPSAPRIRFPAYLTVKAREWATVRRHEGGTWFHAHALESLMAPCYARTRGIVQASTPPRRSASLPEESTAGREGPRDLVPFTGHVRSLGFQSPRADPRGALPLPEGSTGNRGQARGTWSPSRDTSAPSASSFPADPRGALPLPEGSTAGHEGPGAGRIRVNGGGSRSFRAPPRLRGSVFLHT